MYWWITRLVCYVSGYRNDVVDVGLRDEGFKPSSLNTLTGTLSRPCIPIVHWSDKLLLIVGRAGGGRGLPLADEASQDDHGDEIGRHCHELGWDAAAQNR